MTTKQRLVIIYYRQVPHVVDTVLARRGLIRRQIEGELTNMTSLAVAARVSRSTASRFFSGRSTSLAATLRIFKVLHLEFDDVCRPAKAEEVAEWRQRREEERREREVQKQDGDSA